MLHQVHVISRYHVADRCLWLRWDHAWRMDDWSHCIHIIQFLYCVHEAAPCLTEQKSANQSRDHPCPPSLSAVSPPPSIFLAFYPPLSRPAFPTGGPPTDGPRNILSAFATCARRTPRRPRHSKPPSPPHPLLDDHSA